MTADTAAPAKAKEGMVKLANAISNTSAGAKVRRLSCCRGTLTVGYLDGLAEALAKAGYRVVRINFRGSGKSTGSSKGVTLQTNADDVAGVIQALKLGQVHRGWKRLRQSRGPSVCRVSP